MKISAKLPAIKLAQSLVFVIAYLFLKAQAETFQNKIFVSSTFVELPQTKNTHA